VVGTPLVQRTSLTATGTPASLPTDCPALRLASTARACASAAASSTWRNALVFGSRALIAARKAAAIDSADWPWACAASSSAAVFSIMDGSIQYRRDAEEVAVAVRGVGERLIDRQGRGRGVVAEDVMHFERVGQRLDAVGVHLL